eukprot:7265512-Karenia_brevis.AAC.1
MTLAEVLGWSPQQKTFDPRPETSNPSPTTFSPSPRNSNPSPRNVREPIRHRALVAQVEWYSPPLKW